MSNRLVLSYCLVLHLCVLLCVNVRHFHSSECSLNQIRQTIASSPVGHIYLSYKINGKQKLEIMQPIQVEWNNFGIKLCKIRCTQKKIIFFGEFPYKNKSHIPLFSSKFQGKLISVVPFNNFFFSFGFRCKIQAVILFIGYPTNGLSSMRFVFSLIKTINCQFGYQNGLLRGFIRLSRFTHSFFWMCCCCYISKCYHEYSLIYIHVVYRHSSHRFIPLTNVISYTIR